MADGRHFENRYIAISQRNFDEILYTAADIELDERHVIKNEKNALDRLGSLTERVSCLDYICLALPRVQKCIHVTFW